MDPEPLETRTMLTAGERLGPYHLVGPLGEEQELALYARGIDYAVWSTSMPGA